MVEMFANSLTNGFLISSFMGKGIVLLQLAASVVMVSCIIGKMLTLSRLTAATKRVTMDIMRGNSILEYYLSRRPSSNSPVEKIYTATCDRLVKTIDPVTRAALISRSQDRPMASLTSKEIELVNSICEQKLNEEIINLDRGLILISTIVALAPMLGLLGTVWGVLDAFADMGSAGSATIATMAPAISSALVTTVVGLLVAIPGTIFFNSISDHIRKLTARIDGFVNDFTGRIDIEFGGER